MIKHLCASLTLTVLLLLALTSCSIDELDQLQDAISSLPSSETQVSTDASSEQALPVVETLSFLAQASGEAVAESSVICIDYSNADLGYIMVQYLGDHDGKIKFQITGPDERTYTFDLEVGQDYQTFPLTGGSGDYTLNTFEQDEGTSYYTVDSVVITAEISDDTSPYRYPNQFVNYDQDSSVVDLSIQAATDVYSEIDLIASIYNTVLDTLDYDEEKAALVTAGSLTGYIPDLDEVIDNGKGICFDYASLMVAMLRIQNLPAKLVIGYAGEAYHAWINVYTEENGWIDQVIVFDGTEWTLMDPTFADNDGNTATNDYIGDGTNYTEKYVY